MPPLLATASLQNHALRPKPIYLPLTSQTYSTRCQYQSKISIRDSLRALTIPHITGVRSRFQIPFTMPPLTQTMNKFMALFRRRLIYELGYTRLTMAGYRYVLIPLFRQFREEFEGLSAEDSPDADELRHLWYTDRRDAIIQVALSLTRVAREAGHRVGYLPELAIGETRPEPGSLVYIRIPAPAASSIPPANPEQPYADPVTPTGSARIEEGRRIERQANAARTTARFNNLLAAGLQQGAQISQRVSEAGQQDIERRARVADFIQARHRNRPRTPSPPPTRGRGSPHWPGDTPPRRPVRRAPSPPNRPPPRGPRSPNHGRCNRFRASLQYDLPDGFNGRLREVCACEMHSADCLHYYTNWRLNRYD